MNKITIEEGEDENYITKCDGDFGTLLRMLLFTTAEVLKKVKHIHPEEYMSKNIDEMANILKREVLGE